MSMRIEFYASLRSWFEVIEAPMPPVWITRNFISAAPKLLLQCRESIDPVAPVPDWHFLICPQFRRVRFIHCGVSGILSK